MVGGREAAAVTAPDRLLVGRAEVGRSPGLARGRQRLGHSPIGDVGLGKPRPAIAAARFVCRVEGEDRSRILAGLHRLFGPAAQLGVVRPVGVGDQEACVIGEPIIAALTQCPPVVERRSDADRNIGGARKPRAPDIAWNSKASLPAARLEKIQRYATCWTSCSHAPYQALNTGRQCTPETPLNGDKFMFFGSIPAPGDSLFGWSCR